MSKPITQAMGYLTNEQLHAVYDAMSIASDQYSALPFAVRRVVSLDPAIGQLRIASRDELQKRGDWD